LFKENVIRCSTPQVPCMVLIAGVGMVATLRARMQTQIT
jgi:hypothetical protein